nr:reverse transcriptase domain-containing protein [Tanacetum cinerariifolium]
MGFALNKIKYSWEILVKSPSFALGIWLYVILDMERLDMCLLKCLLLVFGAKLFLVKLSTVLKINIFKLEESAKTVAPTPSSAIIQLDVDDNFVVNTTHLNMIRENNFDDYLRSDPHDHIREFLAIYDMFKYGKTESEAVKLLIFPLSLCGEAKTWFNELNEESINRGNK